jgi:tetratricopeptide (TPR) repeat protein
MVRGVVLAVVLLTSGCALPRYDTEFSVAAAGESGQPFFSSRELLVSGLVSESIGLAGRGRLFDAESRLRRALVLSPGDPTITYNLALVLGQQGYAEEALGILNDVRSKQGEHPRYAIATADVYVAQGKLDRGREQLKLAFETFLRAENWAQAALVARSISNLAFADGAEQESLCYSYEAFFLDPSAIQLGYHSSILVALHQYSTADKFIGEQLELNPALGAVPRVHFARGLARAALGNMKGAVDEIEVAQDLLGQDPEIGAEVNVVWWLLRKEMPKTPEDLEDTKLQESLDAVVPEVLRFKDKPSYGLVRWPHKVLSLLSAVPDGLGE